MTRLSTRQQLTLLTCSRAQTARWLEMDLRAIDRLIAAGVLRVFTIGHRTRVPWCDIVRVAQVIITEIQNRDWPEASTKAPAFSSREVNGTRANGVERESWPVLDSQVPSSLTPSEALR